MATKLDTENMLANIQVEVSFLLASKKLNYNNENTENIKHFQKWWKKSDRISITAKGICFYLFVSLVFYFCLFIVQFAWKIVQKIHEHCTMQFLIAIFGNENIPKDA